LCGFQNGGRRHLEFVISPFGPPTVSPLLDSMFSANGVNDQPKFVPDDVILQFRVFVWKSLFPPILGGFEGFGPLKLRRHHFNPKKECSSRGTTHLDILRVKIGSAVSHLGLFN